MSEPKSFLKPPSENDVIKIIGYDLETIRASAEEQVGQISKDLKAGNISEEEMKRRVREVMTAGNVGVGQLINQLLKFNQKNK
jgi:hypothetical protein